MDRIEPGLTGRQTTTVTDDIAIHFLGTDAGRVLATPFLRSRYTSGSDAPTSAGLRGPLFFVRG